jgi:hypothetical protein
MRIRQYSRNTVAASAVIYPWYDTVNFIIRLGAVHSVSQYGTGNEHITDRDVTYYIRDILLEIFEFL